jgi:hypothetical protein
MYTDVFLGAGTTRLRRQPRNRLREALLALAQDQATILSHEDKNWASMTFAGARHRLELLFEGAEAVQAGELFIAFLPDHEFAIPGQLVADAAVTAVDHRLEPPRMHVSCELLLLEE